jgi:hypothetical protein
VAGKNRGILNERVTFPWWVIVILAAVVYAGLSRVAHGFIAGGINADSAWHAGILPEPNEQIKH